VIGDPVDTIAIAVIVLLNAVLGSFRNTRRKSHGRSEKLAALRRSSFG
jgi:hypothetical protein